MHHNLPPATLSWLGWINIANYSSDLRRRENEGKGDGTTSILIETV